MAKLVVFSNCNKFLGKLTKLFTGSYAYHVGWLCEEEDKLFDMHLTRRRRVWSNYKNDKTSYIFYDFPFVTYNYLEHMLETDDSVYGVFDYALFALRPIYHLFGKSTRNNRGVICSEMCNWDLIRCGYKTPWPVIQGPPSPADIERWMINRN